MTIEHQKLLGIDYGAKKVGLAIADSETKIASPFKILNNGKDILANIGNICDDENIDIIVVGVPLGLKGGKSEQYKRVINFCNKLQKVVGVEVARQDEKLTSQYAQRLLKDSKKKHFRLRQGFGGRGDDDVAAMLILQSYLDEQGG